MERQKYHGDKNVIYTCLHAIRKRQGLTQGQVVARLQVMGVNIDQQSLSRIEKDQRAVTDYELACLCRALHVTEREMLADFYEKYPE